MSKNQSFSFGPTIVISKSDGNSSNNIKRHIKNDQVLTTIIPTTPSSNKMVEILPASSRKRPRIQNDVINHNNSSTTNTSSNIIKPILSAPSSSLSSTLRIDSHWSRLRSQLPSSSNNSTHHHHHVHKKNKSSIPSSFTTTTTTTSPSTTTTTTTPPPITTTTTTTTITNNYSIVALDCEMVGVGPSKTSHVGRIFALNEHSETLLDIFVKPSVKITDFRTKWSGILPHHLRNGIPLEEARRRVEAVVEGKILVGHDIRHDLSGIGISHPKNLIRDTAFYPPFQQEVNGVLRPRRLKHIVLEHLAREIQQGKHGHDPKEDAQGCLDLYLKVKKEWERNKSLRQSSQQQQHHQ
jgi:DNA polymerase III epsilon subunit-like protein